VSAPAGLAPPSSGPAPQKCPCGAPSSLISSGTFPPVALPGRQASVGHSSASFASSQNNGGEGTLAGHLNRPATGKPWSASAPVSTHLTDIEASGERGSWPVTRAAPPTEIFCTRSNTMNAITTKTVTAEDTGEAIDGVTVLGDYHELAPGPRRTAQAAFSAALRACAGIPRCRSRRQSEFHLALRSSTLRPSAAVSFVRVAIEIGTPNSTRATVGRDTPASLASPVWLRPRLVRACRICSPMLMSYTPDTSACRLSSAVSRSFTTSRIVRSMEFQFGSPSAVTGRKITASIMS
jgi:hypothetical protein